MRRSLSTTTRVRVFDAANGICSICKQKIHAGQRWEVSHETPIALGGADTPANMRPAHESCHAEQTAKIDLPQIAKAKRQHAAHIGAKVPSATPMPCGRRSAFKKLFSGEVVRR